MKAVDTHPLPGVTERPDTPVTPAQTEPPRSLRGHSSLKRLGETQAFKDYQALLREQHEVAVEIAHEVANGEWCPPGCLWRYRSVERKLADFVEQMRESR